MTPTMQTIKGKIVILANHIDTLKDRKQITCGELEEGNYLHKSC